METWNAGSGSLDDLRDVIQLGDAGGPRKAGLSSRRAVVELYGRGVFEGRPTRS